MKKWSKGFLIFGVTATILGACMLTVGGTSGGIQSLLALSNKPVYTSVEEQDTIKQNIDKLDITLDHHHVAIIDSPDNQIHVNYYKRLTGKTDFIYEVKNGVLSVTDKNEAEPRSMGQGLELLLQASQSITGRYKEIQIALPKGKTLKDIKVRMTKANNLFALGFADVEHVDTIFNLKSNI